METVVPSVGDRIRVVSKNQAHGHVGKIVEKDRGASRVLVKFHDDEVLQLDFDDVCETT